MKTRFALLVGLAVALQCSQKGQAALIAYEGFDYAPVGADLLGKNGGSGFSGPWAAGGFNASVFLNYDLGSASLALSTLPSLLTSGGSVGTLAVGNIAGLTRTLTTPLGTPGTTRYLSVLLRPQGNLRPWEWFGLYLRASTGQDMFAGKAGGGAYNKYVLESRGGAGQVASSTTVVVGEAVLLVVKAEFTAGIDRFTLYVNPVPGGAEPAAGVVKNNSDVGTVNAITLYSIGAFEVDEIRIGETFAEVTPEGPPAPSTPPVLTAPVVTVATPQVTVGEGGFAGNAGTWSDADGDWVTFVASVGTVTGGFTWHWSFNPNDGPTDSQIVTITANDGRGGVGSITFELVVTNVPPTVNMWQPWETLSIPINTAIQFAGGFYDPGQLDTHTAAWIFQGATGPERTVPATISGAAGYGSVIDSITFPEPGVYSFRLVVTDDDGGVGEAATIGNTGLPGFVVVYDPDGGFVTGGGWVWSPAGAFHPGLDEFAAVDGNASFGFWAKYRRGANIPSGNTEFQFKAGGLNFTSDYYEWLVVAGARAQFKGQGTINGEGLYGFLLTAIDGQINGGGDVDRFRIKIWDVDTGVVIYDNQMGEGDNAPLNDATRLQGGSIVIQSAH